MRRPDWAASSEPWEPQARGSHVNDDVRIPNDSFTPVAQRIAHDRRPADPILHRPVGVAVDPRGRLKLPNQVVQSRLKRARFGIEGKAPMMAQAARRIVGNYHGGAVEGMGQGSAEPGHRVIVRVHDVGGGEQAFVVPNSAEVVDDLGRVDRVTEKGTPSGRRRSGGRWRRVRLA